jgi:urease alpha subunit
MASSKLIGSVEKGKLADLVLWSPLSSASSRTASSRRLDRCGAMGRPECLDPDPAARALPADVRAPTAKRCTAVSVVFSSKRRSASGLAQKARHSEKALSPCKTPAEKSPRRA